MSWYLKIAVDRDSQRSLTDQVIAQVKELIRENVLQPGMRLPSSRQLAEDLGVSRSVVVEAYQQLVAEGWLASSRRSGTWVSQRIEPDVVAGPADPGRPAPPAPSTIRWDLRVGGPDVTGFPRQEWLASLQTTLRRASRRDLDYPPVSGHPVLRDELVRYLGRVRGIRGGFDQLMITAGFAQGLSLLCHMMFRLGIGTIGLEDPGQPGHRVFIERIGLRTVPVPVDENGIDVEALARTDARAVVVTPAHQFPTGAPLAPGRRAALLAWANRVDGLVVENDYDGEFWHDSDHSRASLQGEDPKRVIYGGTASKTLAPGLRLGWLCVPPALIEELEQTRERYDLGAGSIEQLAYADFVRTGRLDRHLRKARVRYGSRLRMMAAALAEQLPDVRISGSAAGMHAYLRLPHYLHERALLEAALRRRVLVHGAAHFRLSQRLPDPALVIGYATQPRSALAEAIQLLADAGHELMRQRRTLPLAGFRVLARAGSRAGLETDLGTGEGTSFRG